MRSLLICFLSLVLFGQTKIYSQNPAHVSGVSFKKLFLDYQSQNGGSVFNFKDYRHGFEIGYQRNLGKNLGVNIPLKYGVLNEINGEGLKRYQEIIGLDAVFQYHLFDPNKIIIPYFLAGLGGVKEIGGDFNIQAPIGAGLFFKITPQSYFNFQSEYRFSFAENRNNLHHGLGFVYLFGKPKVQEEVEEIMKIDSDGDGIVDELDLCPNEFGSKELNGCPDKDEDGIPDYLDKCPDKKGLKEFGGCPDTDGDGIPDNEDQCPNEAGPASNKGCPTGDKDGDGIPDDKDKCPNEAGPIENDGCPWSDRDGDGVPDKDDKCPDSPGLKVYNGCPDTDGDGIDDSRDKCPTIPGTVANDGCPEISKEDKKTLDIAMQAVQFQTGSAVLKPESNVVLRQIADIMTKYPDFNMIISGHTDNVGNPGANQALSERRAKACYDFLIKQGVSETRVNYIGYGDSRPIATNQTDKGKSLNRRVEFNLIPR